MALIKQRVTDKIEIVTQFKHLQIREADQIVDDSTGVVESSKFHRRVVECNADVSNESDEIQAIASAVWTPEIKTAYTTHQEAQQI
jgi:hypothetical protein